MRIKRLEIDEWRILGSIALSQSGTIVSSGGLLVAVRSVMAFAHSVARGLKYACAAGRFSFPS
jgi:hypothetical protein